MSFALTLDCVADAAATLLATTGSGSGAVTRASRLIISRHGRQSTFSVISRLQSSQRVSGDDVLSKMVCLRIRLAELPVLKARNVPKIQRSTPDGTEGLSERVRAPGRHK